MDFPAITIRQAHERPEGMDEGTLIMSGLSPGAVLKAIAVVTCRNDKRIHKKVADYDVDSVSHKVLRIILSYTDYINRVTWRKTPLAHADGGRAVISASTAEVTDSIK